MHTSIRPGCLVNLWGVSWPSLLRKTVCLQSWQCQVHQVHFLLVTFMSGTFYPALGGTVKFYSNSVVIFTRIFIFTGKFNTKKIRLSISGNWSFVADFTKSRDTAFPLNSMKLKSFCWIIWFIRFSGGFHMKSAADFTKSAGFHMKSGNMSFCVITKYRSFKNERPTKII